MKRFALFLPLLALAACGGGSTPTPGTPPGDASPVDFTGATWHLQSLQRAGGALVVVEAPLLFTLRLEATTGQASVHADCNSCGGRYALDGSRLEVSPLACTLLACQGALDGDYLALLGGATRASSETGGLVLASDRGTLRFTR
jgi:heat shock protein HslJ